MAMTLADMLKHRDALSELLTELDTREEVCPNCGNKTMLVYMEVCEGCDKEVVCTHCERTGIDERYCHKCANNLWPKEPPTEAQVEPVAEASSEDDTCDVCHGTGVVDKPMYTSRDMALDAGDPSMEGAFCGTAQVTCPQCNGTGEYPPF